MWHRYQPRLLEHSRILPGKSPEVGCFQCIFNHFPFNIQVIEYPSIKSSSETIVPIYVDIHHLVNFHHTCFSWPGESEASLAQRAVAERSLPLRLAGGCSGPPGPGAAGCGAGSAAGHRLVGAWGWRQRHGEGTHGTDHEATNGQLLLGEHQWNQWWNQWKSW